MADHSGRPRRPPQGPWAGTEHSARASEKSSGPRPPGSRSQRRRQPVLTQLGISYSYLSKDVPFPSPFLSPDNACTTFHLSQDPSSASYRRQHGLGVPKATTRFVNVLGRVQAPAYGHTHASDVLQPKDTGPNQPREKARSWSPEETRYKLPRLLSQGGWGCPMGCTAFLQQGVCEMLSTKEPCLSLGCQGFYWGPVIRVPRSTAQTKIPDSQKESRCLR